MQKVILFTKMSSIQKHWENALFNEYNRVHIDSEDHLIDVLKIDTLPILVMVDEMSLAHPEETISTLSKLTHVKILLFNAQPEVHHAVALLDTYIKGYENSFLDKLNLLAMLQSIEEGKSWLFPELTEFIVNKYLDQNTQTEPDFVKTLTPKEKDIALMIADGLTNKEIVDALKIALSTVKKHIGNIFVKAGVSDRVSLALMFK